MASDSDQPSSKWTNEHWHRVEELLQSSLERAPGQRAAFLREACAGDESLLREVQSLLSSHEQAGDFLERPTVEVAHGRLALERAGLLVGRQIGPYELVSFLGSGGMGEVYRATDTRLKRLVAIKFLSAESSVDERRLQYFEREARVASALSHPNIVTVYDIGRSEFGPYIAMELVEGKTLRDTLADGLLPLKRVLQLGAQVADGLAKAHEAGIFHRDLKPDNLMITRDGLVKILDFGLAKLASTPGSEHGLPAEIDNLTSKPGVILGTVGYMSPEQAKGLPADFRSDQFSLGTILYEMLTGKRAFERETAVETLSAIVRDEPEAVTVINPKVPVNIRWIVERCLAKNVEERYASTVDLARDLQNLRDHFSSVAGSDASVPSPAPISRTSKRFRVLVAVGLATLLLAAIGVALRPNSPAILISHQISFSHGHITSAKFAKDDQSVIYGANFSGQPPKLYSTQPGNPELSLSSAGIWSISPSGQMAIAYPCTLNWGECMGILATVPPEGGKPREILGDVTAADWAPDETLAVAQLQLKDRKQRIIRYPGEEVLYVTDGWISAIRVSPKGDRIAFFEHPILGDVGGSVSVLEIVSKKTDVLSRGWKALEGLEWRPSGDEVWFTGSRETKGNGFRLFAVTVSREERLVYATLGTLQLLDISRDGRRLLIRRQTPHAVLMGLAPGDSKERELSFLDFSTAADLSSDGNTLLFYEWGTAVGGNETVYIRKTDGTPAKRLGEGKPLALSTNGQWALALQHSPAPQLVLLPTGLGKPRQLPRGTIGEFMDWAAWSPRGERIFFSAAEQGRRPRTWAQDLDRVGLPQPITDEGMEGVLLSPDGATIAAVDRYGQYWLCPVDGGDPKSLEGYEESDLLLQWSADGHSIFLRGAEDAELKIFRLDLRTFTRKLWKDLTPNAAGIIDIGSDPGQVRITPNGKWYVYTIWTATGELYQVEGLK